MKKVRLNQRELGLLLSNKFVIQGENVLMLKNDELIMSSEDDNFNPIEVEISFIPKSVSDKSTADFLKNLVCEHLNLNKQNVIPYKTSPEECIFKIHFDYKNEYHLMVCEFSQAIKNYQDMNDEDIDFDINDLNIGTYKKLGNSCYYFRWIEDI